MCPPQAHLPRLQQYPQHHPWPQLTIICATNSGFREKWKEPAWALLQMAWLAMHTLWTRHSFRAGSWKDAGLQEAADARPTARFCPDVGAQGCTHNGWRSRRHRPHHRPSPPPTATLAPPEGLSPCPPPAFPKATWIRGLGRSPWASSSLPGQQRALCPPQGSVKVGGKRARPRRAPGRERGPACPTNSASGDGRERGCRGAVLGT